MTLWKRRLSVLAIAMFVPFAVACGAAEEPAPEPAAEEPAAPDPEPEPEPTPVEPEPAPEPDVPQLEGSINITNADFEWGDTNSETADYVWSATVTNDTTATLDITVRFRFYDEADEVIRTETAAIRVAPAQSQRVSGNGTFVWDDANRVYYTATDYDYSIVDGS